LGVTGLPDKLCPLTCAAKVMMKSRQESLLLPVIDLSFDF
jgi:hypothetical protein